MAAKERKGDVAWRLLLDAKGIDLSRATLPLVLTMDDLKRLGKREPRLMLSMDRRSRWPTPLREHHVFPLSNSLRTVVLLRGDGWFDLPPIPDKPEEFRARLPFALASSTVGRGENAHIMRLETSGFLKQFLGAAQLLPAGSGKRTTPRFEAHVFGQTIQVEGAQYEVDAVYESVDDIVPVEMKQRHYASCSIRQVYYPFRALRSEAAGAKAVRPLYVTYAPTSDDYVVRELGFRDPTVWESIHQLKAETIQLRLEAPSKGLLDLSGSELPSERIPQADDVKKIAEFPELVARGMSSSAVIAQHYEFNARQSSYYRDAVEALGLVRLDDAMYRLTPEGKRYVQLEPQGRADFLARRMSKLPVIRAALIAIEEAAEKGLPADRMWQVIRRYADGRGQPCNDTTARRRASTIRAYLDYMGSRTGALVRLDGRYYLRRHVPGLDSFVAGA